MLKIQVWTFWQQYLVEVNAFYHKVIFRDIFWWCFWYFVWLSGNWFEPKWNRIQLIFLQITLHWFTVQVSSSWWQPVGTSNDWRNGTKGIHFLPYSSLWWSHARLYSNAEKVCTKDSKITELFNVWRHIDRRVIISSNDQKVVMKKTLDLDFKGGLLITLSRVLYENKVNFRQYVYKVCKESLRKYFVDLFKLYCFFTGILFHDTCHHLFPEK